MMEQLVQGIVVLLWLGVIGWIVYRLMKSKAIIIYPDGTFKEKVVSSTAKSFEDGKDLYLTEPGCWQRRLIAGLLPQARIIFLKGSPRPVGFHSGEPVTAPSDLKLHVGSDELRVFHRETRTLKLGMPERKFEIKWLLYLAIIVGIAVVAYAIISAVSGPKPAPVASVT